MRFWKKDRLSKQLYPIYADREGETLEFYYSYADRCWKMRYRKQGQDIRVKLFNRGGKLNEDFKAASNRTAAEAMRRGMRIVMTEVR